MVFFRVLKYSECLACKTDGKWLQELKTSIKANKQLPELQPLLIEYADYLEGLDPEIKLACTNEFASKHPDVVVKNQTLKGIIDCLFYGVDTKKSYLGDYGNNSPLGIIIDHLQVIGITQLKLQLDIVFLR
jgi:hypothetical protein